MDNSTEPTKPPLLLPEPQKNEAPSPHTPGAPNAPEDVADVTDMERRDVHREEIEHHTRERRPPQQHGPRRDQHGRSGDPRDFRAGQYSSHSPRSLGSH